MYNDYDFDVIAIDPSGFLNYQSGKASSSLKFVMSCEHAEEFALRQMGKFWTEAAPSPVLPVPFPFDEFTDQPRGYGRMNLVATGFSIEPLSAACFGNNLSTPRAPVGDPADINTMALYFDEGEGADNSCCECVVTLTYEENPCDCCGYDNTNGASPTYREWVVNEYILPGTCISTERNPSYEMFTLPNGGLSWENLPAGSAERQLKPDSYAYKIIPKADIIVHWHNVPVRNLCAIENHLRGFRGSVNDQAWGDVLQCDAAPEDSAACGCGQYEPETIMFIDYQEDRSKRTDAFGGNFLNAGSPTNNMNTTTLKLIFKQKRIERPSPTASYSDTNPCPDNDDEAYGWNHLFLDREGPVDGTGDWMRVVVEATGEPLFELKNFVDIFYPVL
jgi:hypothetical protein